VLRAACARAGGEPAVRLADLTETPPDASRPHLLAPIDHQEVWAAGVTYLRSKAARMEESQGAARFYDLVYDAARPELFLKATPSRVSGPNAPVRIREDARWNVPEPEVALLISPAQQLVGYTIGNDMSSRDIEGENPLYLPQAKVYRQSCALGPLVWLETGGGDHRELAIRLTIQRGGSTVYQGETSTGQMKRKFAELVDWLGRDNLFPHGVFLLTGTGLIPPDDFTLAAGDVVSIHVPEIGTLCNPVVQSR
jgi:2-dehydro-3-deoxy-D-arabinonate dehydratase